MTATSHLSAVPRKRRPAPRTTTGCLCCRLRRKKCDETKPECLGCIRNGLICSFASTTDVEKSETEVASPEQNQATLRAKATRRDTSFHVYRAPGTPWLAKPASRLLFDHYRGKTAGKLGGITGPDNPFVACILPLAEGDSLVMHSVLALSGAHMINGNNSVDVTSSTWIHYGLAVRGLKHELTKTAVTDHADTARLLVTCLLLSHVEIIAGNFHGAVFHHLRASRHFALSLAKEFTKKSDSDIRGFLLELYTYLALINNVTLNLESEARLISFDPFMFSLNSLEGSSSFGVMFGCAHELFELIPRICELGVECHKDKLGVFSSSRGAYHYVVLEGKISAWRPPLRNGLQYPGDLLAAAEIYRRALLIFLHTTFYGPRVTDPLLRSSVNDVIDAVVPVFGQMLEWLTLDENGRTCEPAIATTMLWPLTIIGSCMVEPDHRQYLRTILTTSQYEMQSLSCVMNLLDWLWEDPNDYAYGPYGLEMVMKKRKINICIG
ncbi:fungal-specific transcription factor domain-containing protein [Cadophora sp. MPI-SDFR-AT-0126]|nr:fungal-specific transcription factor domain-containing protein [Leotiomycetes sp. MPI-SDFR-AT-0126]